MFLAMEVHNQKVSCPYDGPSWPEAFRGAFIKLNYNKMNLVGFMCNNSIATRCINIVKTTPNQSLLLAD